MTSIDSLNPVESKISSHFHGVRSASRLISNRDMGRSDDRNRSYRIFETFKEQHEESLKVLPHSFVLATADLQHTLSTLQVFHEFINHVNRTK